MKELHTFRGDHFVLHISKDYPRSNQKLKDYPYDLIISSEYAHPPTTKQELENLSEFISRILKKYND